MKRGQKRGQGGQKRGQMAPQTAFLPLLLAYLELPLLLLACCSKVAAAVGPHSREAACACTRGLLPFASLFDYLKQKVLFKKYFK